MLEIQDLHVKFHNRDREAVSGVSLTIQDGEILGLVGESGSGKSVTAMSVAGLLPRKRCDYTGRILLDGQELLHADRSVLREIQGAEIGVVFQEPQSCMDPLMKIGPQVEETLRIHTQLSKEERHRRAVAAGEIRVSPETMAHIKNGTMKKGDVLAVAQVAGIQAAKHNWELIPMCHPLPLTGIDITFRLSDEPCMVEIQAAVTCTGVTGVEMEALTAVSVAALTVYDMCKAVQKDMEITNIRLLEKSGGKSGDYKRED